MNISFNSMLKIIDASPGIGAPLTEQETKDFLTTKVKCASWDSG
jgi:hypothetical protein